MGIMYIDFTNIGSSITNIGRFDEAYPKEVNMLIEAGEKPKYLQLVEHVRQQIDSG